MPLRCARPPLVIAELGVNHDGEESRALGLVEAAARAGADAVKLQLFRAPLLLSRAARLAEYQARAGERDPAEMLGRLELGPRSMARVIERAHAAGLHAVVTVFSLELVAPAAALGFDAFKFASPDLVNLPLLRAVAGATGKRPLILSTGAASRAEVARTLRWLGDEHDRLALLQCVSSYPTRPRDASLAALRDLARLFGGPLGYSDHTTGEDTGALAVACGARILEKHLTLDPGAPGPDHAASLDPEGFARYVALARAARVGTPETGSADVRLGPPAKRVLACERDVRRLSRQSVVPRRDLGAGHVLTRGDLTVKRPGTGIPAWRLEAVIGRALARAVEGDVPLRASDLAAYGGSGRGGRARDREAGPA
ncbi:MAG TPA: N-acetylneuraminate synthase family protein [Phycisphaerales bacterium]|nr:N-acetylneuraminate synthase family protein [Phycisphaerales bacterium]